MIEFTNGPFTVVDTSWSTALIVRPDGRAIAVLSIEGDETLNEETEQALHDRQLADAHRFAAVDELYEALFTAVQTLSEIYALDKISIERRYGDALDLPEEPPLLAEMRGILAKARGEIERS